MKRFPIIAALAVLISAASCQKFLSILPREDLSFSVNGIDEPWITRSVESPDAIVLQAEDCDDVFLVITETPHVSTCAATRSQAISSDNIASVYGQFTIDAFRRGQNTKYMDGVTVRYEEGNWNIVTDETPYVWPENDRGGNDELSFWAFAPSLNADIVDSFTVTDVSADSFAFSYAYEKDQASPYTRDLLFAHKVQDSGEVSLTFSHALAALSARISEDQDPFNKILSCKFDGIYTKGSCVCTPAGEKVSFAWAGSAKGGYDSTLGDGDGELNAENLHFAIPQILPEGASITVNVDNHGVAATHSFSIAGTQWKPGYKYVYILRDAHELSATLPRGAFFWGDVMRFVGMVSHTLNPYDNDLFDDVVFKTNVPAEDLVGRNYLKLRGTQNDVYCVFDKAERRLTICTPHVHLLAAADMSLLLKGNNGSDYSAGAPFFFVETMDLTELETVNATSMSECFICCGLMSEFRISEKFNTSNVLKMDKMFYECRSLERLDLSVFDTRKVTDMSGMLQNCYKLSTLILGENFVIPGTKTDMMTDCGRDAAAPVVYCTDETWTALSSGTGLDTEHWTHRTLDQLPSGL